MRRGPPRGAGKSEVDTRGALSNMIVALAVPQVPLVDSLLIALEARQAAEDAYRSDLIAVVLWSLGIAVAIVILMVSVGWIVNFRIYKSDLATMKRELDEELRADFQRDIGNWTKALQEHIDKLMAEAHRLFELQAQQLKTIVYGDRFSEYMQQARDHFRDEEYDTAVLACHLALTRAVEAGVSAFVRESLGLMVESLESGEPLNHVERESVEALVRQVPDEFELLRDRALRALADGRIRPSL